MIKIVNFDDYLGLLNYNFSEYKYVIFIWNSWSWKSSYIKELLIKNKTLDKNISIIDEVFDVLDFFKNIIKLFGNKQFLIASHISEKYFYVFYFFWKIKFIKTDICYKKIWNYLKNKGYSYTEETLVKYVDLFSSTYTDIDIILEFYIWNSFDEAFNIFIRNNRIKLSWNKKAE